MPGPDDAAQPQPEGLRFTVEPRIAAPGTIVTLILHNGTGQEVGYNLCGSELEHLQGGAWRPPPPNAPTAGLPVPCTAVLMGLVPGRQDGYPLRLPTTLAAGTYRFKTSVATPPFDRGLAGFVPIHTETFTVRR